MARNLNYAASGSKCGNGSSLSDANTSTCDTYGRLYDWATAMALPDCGYGTSCASQIGAKHRGICPSGWHIPSDAEWTTLTDYVGGNAGTKLKSSTGWNAYSGVPAGTDEYGFSALPGGYGYSGGGFYGVGNYGYWWSASEGNSSIAYGRSMDYYDEYVLYVNNYESYLYSVRCLKDEGEPAKSSSSKPQVAVSSSSSVRSSGPSVSYEGETYQTVVIGTQTWMARNLNYAASGSKCYDNDPANCATYGRLYNWATAMALPSICNSSSCSSQINAKHRGICPSGWHIPSDAEWTSLVNFAGGSTAGQILKAESGWNDYNGTSGNGANLLGFSALPGGYGNSGGNFYDVGNSGDWWSSTEDPAASAWDRIMRHYDADVGRYNYGKTNLYSVRCLKDEGEPAKSSSSQPQVAVSSSSSAQSSSSVAVSSSSTPPSNSSSSPQTGIIHGTPVTYQGETYQTVVIGTQTWMARNLNYAADSSKCYKDEPANCATYGRLYDWATAMALPSSCNGNSCSSQINAKHRGICPSGWHLPSNDDWDKLVRYVDGTSGTSSPYESPTAGPYLKATSGWNAYDGIPAGTDDFGFSALPGGYGSSGDRFYYVGTNGSWWSASEDVSYLAYGWGMFYYDERVGYGSSSKSILFSVRCVKD
jgi:uncharacterized protein (TIGR02145 family)